MLQLSKPIILASASPRRRQLLSDAGFEFEILSKNIAEIYPEELKREAIPLFLARLKGESLATESEGKILIAADTIVVLGEKILGKPSDESEAIDFLSQLSGNTHEVITGVYVSNGFKKVQFHETTQVSFRKLSLDEIKFYVKKYQPLDKAGAYGVQDWMGLTAVSHIQGCFYNVMGLPMAKLYEELKHIDC
jgi:septum formation protein